MIDIKILGYHSAQRYAVRQTVITAQRFVSKEYPDQVVMISELKDWIHIEQYTYVLSAPSLVENGQMVCVGRFPSKDEVLGWYKSAIEAS
jgi:hypothetical protein